MARATATAAPAPEKTQDTGPATFDWDTLEEPSIVEYQTAVSKAAVDWEKETPDAIKQRVTTSYAAYEEAYKAAEASARQSTGIPAPQALPEGSVKRITEAAGRAATRKQVCKSQAQAEQFVKLAKGYASSLGYTFRSGPVKDGQTEIVYRVKPAEVRARKS